MSQNATEVHLDAPTKRKAMETAATQSARFGEIALMFSVDEVLTIVVLLETWGSESDQELAVRMLDEAELRGA